jgi:hypothetical protein
VLFLSSGLLLLRYLAVIFFHGTIIHRSIPRGASESLISLSKRWINTANIIFPFISACYRPLLVIFEALLNFHINLSSVEVHCKGSLAPVELLFDIFVLSFVAIVIESDYYLLLTLAVTSVNAKYLEYISDKTFAEKLSSWRKILLCSLLMILQPASLLTNLLAYSMTLLAVGNFMAAKGRHDSNTSCDTCSVAPHLVTPVAWHHIL